jgi:hypothetical protein
MPRRIVLGASHERPPLPVQPHTPPYSPPHRSEGPEVKKIQALRPDKHKPSVVKEYNFWWAQVYTADNTFLTELHKSQPEALAAAYELAELNKGLAA